MTAGPPKIRRATASDLGAILHIERQAPGASHWTAVEYERMLSSQVILVAESGQVIAGFLCAQQAAEDWELENIAVVSALQRRGIASDLLKALLDHVGRSSASTLFLEVRESNAPARRFYESHGFAEIGRRRHYYHSPEEDAVIYRLNLSNVSSREPKT